jgi:phage/plasmid-associated DNA primase
MVRDNRNDDGDETGEGKPDTGILGTTCPVEGCEFIADTQQGRKSHVTQSHPHYDSNDDASGSDDGSDDADDGDGDTVESGQSVLTPDGIETPDDDGDDGSEDLDDRAEKREQAEKDASRLWDDARDTFEQASKQGTPTTRRDGRADAITALERETSFMSVRGRCDESHTDLWRWTDDNGWSDDAFLHVEERLKAELGEESDKRLVRQVVHSLGARNRVTEDCLNAGDVDATLVPVANGVIRVDDIEYDAETMTIDTDTVTLGEMDPEHRFTYRVQARWDPESADLEGYDAWLDELTMDRDDDIRVLNEFVGHSLHQRYPADGFAVILGQGGSGKSQYLETIKKMMGEDNTSPVSIADVEEGRFAAVHVVDSRLNINTELDGVDIDSIAKLKTLSAGEELLVEKKGVDAYFCRNDATLMYASDDPPAFQASQNDALGRRLYPVEFPMQYVDSPDPANPYELQSLGKLGVQETLQADERLQAALVRGVEGLVRLLEEDGFTSDSTRSERIDRYNSYADPIKDFRRICIEDAGSESQIESGLLAAVYDAFAADKDHDGKSMQQITGVLDGLQGISFSKGRTRSWSDEQKTHTVYTGLRFSAAAIRHYVPDEEMEHLDLSALHDDESDDTRDSALGETVDGDDDSGAEAGQSDDGQETQDTVVADGGSDAGERDAIDRAVLQHADDDQTVGELAGLVSGATGCDDLDKIKTRIEAVRESGDGELTNSDDGDGTGTDDEDPPKPSTGLDEWQCRNCGVRWPPSMERVECDRCGESVDVEWNVETQRVGMEAAEGLDDVLSVDVDWVGDDNLEKTVDVDWNTRGAD